MSLTRGARRVSSWRVHEGFMAGTRRVHGGYTQVHEGYTGYMKDEWTASKRFSPCLYSAHKQSLKSENTVQNVKNMMHSTFAKQQSSQKQFSDFAPAQATTKFLFFCKKHQKRGSGRCIY